MVALDEDLIKLEEEKPAPYLVGKGLHGRRLALRNDFRPAKRYLYYSLAATILKRQRCEVPGYMDDHKNLLNDHTIWASPGKYIRKGALRTLAQELGHMEPRAAQQLFPEEEGDLSNTRLTTRAAEQATAACLEDTQDSDDIVV